jgi:adenine phosphoribosyltransferase
MSLKGLIRTIPDHPKPGVMFRDITTLLLDAKGLHDAVEGLAAAFAGKRIDKVAGIEARGFILGGAVAQRLAAGFVPVRKRGKLPFTTLGQDYALEYGTDRVEIHSDAIAKGEQILIVDDLIATGGTASAALDLIARAGGTVVGCAFIVDLPDLGGSRKLRERGVAVHALCDFEGE